MPTFKNKKRKYTAKGPRKRIPTRKSLKPTIEHHISKKRRSKRGCHDEECPICQENIFNNKELKKFARKPISTFKGFKLACGHCFHIFCINKWIQEKNTCPNCIREINPRTITKLKKATIEDEPEYEAEYDPFNNDNHSMEEEQSSPNYMQNYALSAIFNSIQD